MEWPTSTTLANETGGHKGTVLNRAEELRKQNPPTQSK